MSTGRDTLLNALAFAIACFPALPIALTWRCVVQLRKGGTETDFPSVVVLSILSLAYIGFLGLVVNPLLPDWLSSGVTLSGLGIFLTALNFVTGVGSAIFCMIRPGQIQKPLRWASRSVIVIVIVEFVLAIVTLD